ncbi:hypothetical protein Ae717Ps2_7176 [Pseudonocardia sp. Ae717_Ps2]|nr:hypothetical protein Ae717Ps2_7176 [Pseudonocardia sp. Ae717_Ps2]
MMDKTIKDKNTGEDKVVGAQVYYRADAIRPIGAARAGRTSRPRDGGPAGGRCSTARWASCWWC